MIVFYKKGPPAWDAGGDDGASVISAANEYLAIVRDDNSLEIFLAPSQPSTQRVEQGVDEVDVPVPYCSMALVPCVLSFTFRTSNHLVCLPRPVSPHILELSWNWSFGVYFSQNQNVKSFSLSSQIVFRLLVVRSRPISAYKSNGMVNIHPEPSGTV